MAEQVKTNNFHCKKEKTAPAVVRFFQGMLVGVGGILPGISGGVLCAIFGLYQPVMELLAHPIKNFKSHIRLLLPAGIGLVVGFLALAKLVLLAFDKNGVIATCVFTGLILGMLPSLWREAEERGRGKSSYISMAIAFAVVFGVFLVLEFTSAKAVEPDFFWFLVSGVLFGLGIVVPGMSASSPLLYLGLMEPLLDVAGSFMDGVTGLIGGSLGFSGAISVMRFDAALPFIIGVAGIFIALSRLVTAIIGKYPAEFYHGIFGIVTATTLPILIFTIDFGDRLLIKLICVAAGFAVAWGLDVIQSRLAPSDMNGSASCQQSGE